jgi:hypothetical protein
MADIIKRLHYFNGQFLEESDFNDEQAYHLDRQRRHNRLLHTPGIAEGLTVTGNAGAGEVNVGMGTALDGQGRMLVLANGQNLVLNNVAGQTVFVVLSYEEVGTDPATVGNQGEATRWEERPKLELVAQGSAPPESTHIRLARVVVTGGGTVSSIDTTVRRSAGVRVGSELSLPRLRFSSDQLQEAQWPEVKADGNRKVEVNDHLEVTGNLTAGSVTTGGAVSAASVTATGALSGASLTASGTVTAGNFTTTGTVTTNKVTSTGAGASISTTGAVTAGSFSTTGAATAGSFTTTGNLSVAAITASGTVTAANFTTNGTLSAREITTNALNFTDLTIPGDLTVNGRISGTLAQDIVQAIHIADAAVTTDKLADFAVTTNEIRDHAVNNAKLAFNAVSLDRLDPQARSLVEGALSVKDYDIRQRGVAYVYLSNEAHGVTKEVKLGFRPRIIFAFASMEAFFAGNYHGFTSQGFADAESGHAGFAVGQYVYQGTGGVTISAHAEPARLVSGAFWDATVTPQRNLTLGVAIDSINDNGFYVKMVRTVWDSRVLIPGPLTISMYLYCMGA